MTSTLAARLRTPGRPYAPVARRLTPRFSLFLLLGLGFGLGLGTAACASGGGEGGDTRVASNPEVIDQEEIAYWAERGTRDLAQLVGLARPRWLRAPSGQRSIYGSGEAAIVVFRDQRYLGLLDELRNQPLDGVMELRWLNASEADALPGPGGFHAHGGIMILTTASLRP
jgi:hypothetical protein